MPRKKILLAEDDIDDRSLFYEFFANRDDVEILPAVENGEELLHLLNAIREGEDLPDLIILDQNMPKMNGKQTLHLLKTSHRYARIPAIIYSTYSNEQLQNECSSLGASLVVSKPLTFEGYQQMMDCFLKVISA